MTYYLIERQKFSKLLILLTIVFILNLPINNWISFFIFTISLVSLSYSQVLFTKKKIIAIFILIFFSIIFKSINFNKIEQGFLIYSTNEKLNYEKILPIKVNEFLNEIVGKNYNVDVNSEPNWSFSADGIWQNKKMSRKINKIDFENVYLDKIGTFNDASMQINHNNWSPYSLRLPLVLKYELPNSLRDSKLCFIGLIYINNKFIENHTKDCLDLKNESLIFYAFDIESLNYLSLELISENIIYKYSNFFKYIQYFLVIILLMLCVKKIPFFPNLIIILGFLNYFIFLLDLVFKEYLPSKFSPFIYMGRGNDGLVHYGHGREIAENLSNGNFLIALRGGADVFHWMPGLRYFHSISFFIFGETILGYLLLGLVFPFIILNLLKKYFTKKSSMLLILIFLLFPIFESYGFFSFYYMKLIAKGFGGTLGWFCLILSVNLLLSSNLNTNFNKFTNTFFAGFLLIVLISCRPNLLPTVLFLNLGFLFLFRKNFYRFFGLIIGSSSFFLFLAHNYFYGGDLSLITNSSSTLRNMPIPPILWINFISQLFNLQFDYTLFLKLFSHVSIWINFYEIWLMLAILSLIGLISNKKFSLSLKIITFSLLMGHSIYIFYAGVPRYTYGLWLLSFVIMLIYLNEKLKTSTIYNKFISKIMSFNIL